MNIETLRKFSPQLHSIAKKYGIAKISVFGSIARGEDSSSSDVDFLVEMVEGASLFGAAGFAYDSEQLLGLRVDIVPTVTLSKITDQEFVRSIEKDAKPL